MQTCHQMTLMEGEVQPSMYLLRVVSPISWISKLQKIIALFITETEYVAMTEQVKKCCGCRIC